MIPTTDYVQEPEIEMFLLKNWIFLKDKKSVPDGGDEDEDAVVGVEDNNNHNCRCLEHSKRKD